MAEQDWSSLGGSWGAPGSAGSVDPETLAGGDGSDGGAGEASAAPQAARRRRRRTKKSALDLAGVSDLLLAVHLGLATVTRRPELAVSQDEARALAEAAERVARHYDIAASQKALDWAALGLVSLTIYVPRIMAIRASRDKMTQPPPTRQPPPAPHFDPLSAGNIEQLIQPDAGYRA